MLPFEGRDWFYLYSIMAVNFYWIATSAGRNIVGTLPRITVAVIVGILWPLALLLTVIVYAIEAVQGIIKWRTARRKEHLL